MPNNNKSKQSTWRQDYSTTKASPPTLYVVTTATGGRKRQLGDHCSTTIPPKNVRFLISSRGLHALTVATVHQPCHGIQWRNGQGSPLCCCCVFVLTQWGEAPSRWCGFFFFLLWCETMKMANVDSAIPRFPTNLTTSHLSCPVSVQNSDDHGHRMVQCNVCFPLKTVLHSVITTVLPRR